MQFERPISGNVPSVDQVLATYVTGAGRLSPDGHTLKVNVIACEFIGPRKYSGPHDPNLAADNFRVA